MSHWFIYWLEFPFKANKDLSPELIFVASPKLQLLKLKQQKTHTLAGLAVTVSLHFSIRNIDGLIVELFPVLDTNAKRTLWPYIIQILPEEEQEVCKRKVIYLIDRHAAGKSVWWTPKTLAPEEGLVCAIKLTDRLVNWWTTKECKWVDAFLSVSVSGLPHG